MKNRVRCFGLGSAALVLTITVAWGLSGPSGGEPTAAGGEKPASPASETAVATGPVEQPKSQGWTIPEVPLTCPAGQKAVQSKGGLSSRPLEDGSTASPVEWDELSKRFAQLSFGDPPNSDTLPTSQGSQVNLIALMRDAVKDTQVQEVIRARLGGEDRKELDKRLARVDESYREVIKRLLDDADLWSGSWSPSTSTPGGVHLLHNPFKLGGREYYMAAVFLPGTLLECKTVEYDLARQRSDNGHAYTALFPIEGMFLRGENDEGDFVARGIYSRQKVYSGGGLNGASSEYVSLWQVVVDHYWNGELLATYCDLGEQVGDDRMDWMFGQDVWLEVASEGQHLGFIVVSYVGFSSSVYSSGGWFGIGSGTYGDEPHDHRKSLIAHLAGMKRRLSHELQEKAK